VSIHTKFYKRLFFDFLIKTASLLFNHTSAITDIAAQQLGIRKYKLLPVGGANFNTEKEEFFDNEGSRDIFSSGDYVFIYVGTLNKRGILDCVKGFHSYKRKNPSARIRFAIIGTSSGGELKEINEYIEKHQLESFVHTLGYIPQSKLSYYFNHAHCGISYMPLSMPFSQQPNTKTYEYLVNGLPVIAIASPDNLHMVNDAKVQCGVIIEDSPQGMEYGIEKIMESRDLYNKENIAAAFGKYEWDNIFNIYLDDALSLSAS
jgi:glycosyltransferase involved in cell wall biosynthesis